MIEFGLGILCGIFLTGISVMMTMFLLSTTKPEQGSSGTNSNGGGISNVFSDRKYKPDNEKARKYMDSGYRREKEEDLGVIYEDEGIS